MVLKNLRSEIIKSYRNLKTKVLIIKNIGSRGQTKDLSKGRRLSGLYNKKSDLRKELI